MDLYKGGRSDVLFSITKVDNIQWRPLDYKVVE